MFFDLYSGSKKQMLMAMLVSAESDDITDIRILRQRLQDAIDQDFLHKRLKMTPEEKEQAKKAKKLRAVNKREFIAAKHALEIGSETCPACGSKSIIVASKMDIDGEIIKYKVCARLSDKGTPEIKCGYSELI